VTSGPTVRTPQPGLGDVATEEAITDLVLGLRDAKIRRFIPVIVERRVRAEPSSIRTPPRGSELS
jgi:hypothetical protein